MSLGGERIMAKKKIIEAKDIFERNEREEKIRQFPQIRAMIGRVNLPPAMIRELKQVMDEEEGKMTERKKSNRRWTFFVMMFLMLILITITLGCIWLIKFFIGGIFG